MSKEELVIQENIGKNLDFLTREAYNLLKTNISFVLQSQEGLGICIGVTSSEPQEGKSFTSLNLAYSYAAEGKKVCLLDADLRKSYVYKRLGVEQPTVGASSYLAGIIKDYHEALTLNALDNPNLSVILAGPVPPNPYVLLISPNFKKLIDELKQDFDMVIVDLPPVNAVSDTLAVKDAIDGVILVVRHNNTRRKELIEAVNMLTFVKINLLGIVYNGYYHGNGSYKKDYKNKYYKGKTNSSKYYYKEADNEQK